MRAASVCGGKGGQPGASSEHDGIKCVLDALLLYQQHVVLINEAPGLLSLQEYHQDHMRLDNVKLTFSIT